MREKESGTISFKWSNLHQTSSFSWTYNRKA
jgi:hypothetical protein